VRRRERYDAIKDILTRRDWDALEKLPATGGQILRALMLFVQDNEALVRWRAVEALGVKAKALFPEDRAVREVIRSFIWTMCDESGNLCRMAPEAIGEILAMRPDLRPEFAHLLPQYLVEEPFESGTMWALCRLTEAGHAADPDSLQELEACFGHRERRRAGLSRRLARLAGLNRSFAAYPPVSFEDYDPSTGTLKMATEPPPPGQS